ncbi:ABC transporter ATP-binding protein [Millisia brevis]|uniref:ABC transporter ATP-binding protein n=1 Tax=Millisia brevis TaxID=264148 RepID=UPI00082AED15|nr:ABC transporter ATP-binding protein [Millisia brevis]
MSPEAAPDAPEGVVAGDEASGLVLRAELAGRKVRYDLAVPAGTVLAVLGPNGAGKSTLLDLIAGVLAPTDGTITLGGRVLADAGERRRFVPPHRRRIVLLAQRALLFPHLTVRDNVAFGPRSTGAGRSRAREQAERWLGVVGMSDFAGRRPDTLSGGQAQRVAIARALAADPRLLLLDEPLSALDIDTAPQIRGLLRTVLRDPAAPRTAVVVTHDPLDALVLADRVIVVEGGDIRQQGTVREVFDSPRSPFIARMVGGNLVEGAIEEPGILLAAEGVRIAGTGTLPVGSPALAIFDASAVALHLQAGAGSERNVFPGIITGVEPRGSAVRVTVEHRGHAIRADITLAAAAELKPAPGDAVDVAIKAQQVRLHPAG